MNRILVCIDFSDVTPRVIAEASRLANGLQAQAVLLHVCLPVTARVMGSPTGGAMLAESDVAARQRQLQPLADDLARVGVNTAVKVIEGDVTKCILDEADRLRPERIVIGSHGHGKLFELLVGSVTAGVLQRSKVPVLVVPSRSQ